MSKNETFKKQENNNDNMAFKLTKQLENEIIAEVAGEETIPLVEAIKGKVNVSEFIIATDINLEINKTRRLLYRLYDANLVGFMKKKDKKKGWYVYYWTYHPEKLRFLYLKLKREKLDNLKERLKREREDYFFTCVNRCMRVDFDRATEFEFKCPECGELMFQENNNEKIVQIKEDINNLEKEIAKI